jgi:hypothetical protein
LVKLFNPGLPWILFHALRPGRLTTFHLPAQDHSQPALALGGITVSPLPLIIVGFLSAAFLVLTATPAAFSELNRNS